MERNEECNIRLEMIYVRCSPFMYSRVEYIQRAPRMYRKTFFESNIGKTEVLTSTRGTVHGTTAETHTQRLMKIP